jgi:peptidoglycan/LPS O-acetylase OafA/YrhL
MQSQEITLPTETAIPTSVYSAKQCDAPERPVLAKIQRIPALDFTKGALVLIMVLYHWINYFIGPSWRYYPYLRFLTPSFIFITGFMISHVYLSKYAATDPRLARRLVIRGLKLLAIFFVLNGARSVILPMLGKGAMAQSLPSAENLFTIFVSGNLAVTGTKLISFSILIPISYLLILSGLLMLPCRIFRYAFHVACGLLLLSVLILYVAGLQSYNLQFITIGMLGVLTGFMPISMINSVIRHPYLLALLYLCYAFAITIWNVPFLLLIVGVLLSLAVIFVIGASGSEYGVARNEVALLGKYSLLGYIAQVAILQLLSAGSHKVNLGFSLLPVSFAAAFVLTIVSVELTDRARPRIAFVDNLYKLVLA